ncbi:MAG TPA: 1,4-beta-xylanase [Bryobacteraceae bacterium]|nr:1,4-beta-xylanase [Bryobacteraceae bacterium]
MTNLSVAVLLASALCAGAQSRWTESKAHDWYKQQPWLVGANYVPATAINELEMWQADTFDAKQIDKELGWAASLGMNTMRVFLHDLLWEADANGYRKRIDAFLKIAAKHKIRPMLVLFDSVWDPFPQLGKQRSPKPGVHNSGWMQSPGAKALADPAQYPRLEKYVKGVVGAFGRDRRVLAWDIWNEPDNPNEPAYAKDEPANKEQLVRTLLPQVFEWARTANPTQPLTCGVWRGDWSSDAKLTPVERIQLDNSDVISFHNYEDAASFENRIHQLERYKRPILCTEYMARGNKSTFEGSMPVAKKYNVAVYNWGLVAGKTQTHLPWDSWANAYTGTREPSVWFHEIFHPDGRPYRQEEVGFIRKMTGKGGAAATAGSGR